MVNVQDRWGRTPLHVTLLNLSHAQNSGTNYTDVVRLLLDRKSDPNQADKHHATPLFIAASSGNIEITKMLIKHGADVNKPGRHHTTPLMLAAIKGNINICQLLIFYNCKVNCNHLPSGKTCLQLAIQKGFLDILRLLVSAGCDLHSNSWSFYNNRELWQQRSSKISSEMWVWLDEVFTKPLTLQHWCRTTIRRSLGKTLHQRVGNIQYPDSLKNFILMKDLIPDVT